MGCRYIPLAAKKIICAVLLTQIADGDLPVIPIDQLEYLETISTCGNNCSWKPTAGIYKILTESEKTFRKHSCVGAVLKVYNQESSFYSRSKVNEA